MSKRYDFLRTTTDDKQADYVIDAVKKEYGGREDWIIGEIKKEPLSNGEVQVTVELTKLKPEEINDRRMSM